MSEEVIATNLCAIQATCKDVSLILHLGQCHQAQAKLPLGSDVITLGQCHWHLVHASPFLSTVASPEAVLLVERPIYMAQLSQKQVSQAPLRGFEPACLP